MIYRRPPQSLKEIAFVSWLSALDIGTTSPAQAPPLFLTRALEGGAKLKDATVVRIAEEAAVAGLEELTVKEELLNPTLLHQLTLALTIQASRLKKLGLKLSSRITNEDTNSLLADAFKEMTSLEDISLIGGANDELLKALAAAQPPLINADFSHSSQLTDEGLEALLTDPHNGHKSALQNLQHLNIWETNITTKGCMLVLKYCLDLLSLMCQWTAESLVLMDLKQSNALRLEQLFVIREEISGNLFSAIANLCPCLKILSIKKPKDTLLDLDEILTELPMLEDFSLQQYYPLHHDEMYFPCMAKLKRLTVLSSSSINLDHLAEQCPSLTHLTLDSVSLELTDESVLKNDVETTSEIKDEKPIMNAFKHLKELKIVSGFISFSLLNPALILHIVNRMTDNLRFLHLDNCENFEERHFYSLLNGDSLMQIEDIRLSRASNLSDDVIHSLTQRCPSLKRLVLTMLSRERREQLEALKAYLKDTNVNLEIITFSNRSLSEKWEQT